jgi:hypothetical protein
MGDPSSISRTFERQYDVLLYVVKRSGGQVLSFAGHAQHAAVEIAGDCWNGMPRKPCFTVQRQSASTTRRFAAKNRQWCMAITSGPTTTELESPHFDCE